MKKGSMHRRSTSERVFDLANVVLLGLFALTALYPFVYTLSISMSTAAEASRDGLHLYPKAVSFSAYRMVLTNPQILVALGNSVFRTVVGTALTVVMTCLCAYALSRKRMPLRGFFRFLVLFTMIFHGGVVPTFIVIKSLHLIDSLWVYVLPMLTNAFSIVVVMRFFESIPEDLAESAAIDGASNFRILFQIYMPLSRPVLATISLWTAVAHWNMWFDALLYVNTEGKQVLQTMLRRVVLENSTELLEKGLVNPDITQFTPETIKAATVVLTIAPVLLVCPFLMRHFVKGIMLGSVKQ